MLELQFLIENYSLCISFRARILDDTRYFALKFPIHRSPTIYIFMYKLFAVMYFMMEYLGISVTPIHL